MAGLLKQLQKNKPKRDVEIAPVVLNATVDVHDAPETGGSTRELDRRFVEAEMLFHELVAETPAPAATGTATPMPASQAAIHGATGMLKVVRSAPQTRAATGRGEKEKDKDGAPPEWAKPDRKI